MATKRKVLFVCLGNSCRSPIGESVFKQYADETKWTADSAALADWNVGLLPNPRAVDILKRHNLTSDHIARQVTEKDFFDFDFIFAMDRSNYNALHRLAPSNGKAKIFLLGDYHDNKGIIIRDPYFDVGDNGFELCYQQCCICCRNFLAQFDSN
uniref:Low molecular weight phosphotyrosine protein phosphatase n=1 Tax=Xenopsylla cheopis TaxID=163159 RepID=A0A6M2DM81_XENCH